jgi:hypothetical protein
MIGSRSTTSNQPGNLEPGRRHRDDAGQRQVGALAQPQRDGAAERAARDHHRIAAAPLEHERGGELVELGQDRARREPRGLAEAGQVDGYRAPAGRRELGQQRAPGVGRVAPAVQQDDARPGALELEDSRPVPGELHAVLDERLHSEADTQNAVI